MPDPAGPPSPIPPSAGDQPPPIVGDNCDPAQGQHRLNVDGTGWHHCGCEGGLMLTVNSDLIGEAGVWAGEPNVR